MLSRRSVALFVAKVVTMTLKYDVDFTTVWAAHSGMEGKVIGTYSSEESATAAARGKGEWGGNGVVSSFPAVIINRKCYLLMTREPVDLDDEERRLKEQLRQQGLARLSPDERKALGFT